MTRINSGGSIRRHMTRFLATGALLSLYALGTIGVTGVVMTTGSSPAVAQRGGGGGGGGGGRGGRGGGGRGRGRGRGNGGAAAVGTAIGVIGGIIAAEAARREEAIEECFRRYGRRFDPDTMTVVGRNGRRFPCP